MLTPENENKVRLRVRLCKKEKPPIDKTLCDVAHLDALLDELDYTRMLLKDALESRGESLEEVQRLRTDAEKWRRFENAAKMPGREDIINATDLYDGMDLSRPHEEYIGPKGGRGIRFLDTGQIVYGVRAQ